MKATATRATYVTNSDGQSVLLQPGESAMIKDGEYGPESLFVKAGYLTIERGNDAPQEQPKGKRGRPAKQPDPEQERPAEDTESESE